MSTIIILLLAGRAERETQEIANRLNSIGSEKKLHVNMNETKTMTLNGRMSNIILKGNRLEQVDTFQYLGSLITEDTECSKDIRENLARVKIMPTLAWMKHIGKSHNIKLTTKVRLMEALV